MSLVAIPGRMSSPTAVRQLAASWQDARMSWSMRGVMSSMADKGFLKRVISASKTWLQIVEEIQAL